MDFSKLVVFFALAIAILGIAVSSALSGVADYEPTEFAMQCGAEGGCSFTTPLTGILALFTGDIVSATIISNLIIVSTALGVALTIITIKELIPFT